MLGCSYRWLDEPMANYLMHFSEREKTKFREAGSLLQIKPAIWPVGDNVIGGNDHFSGCVVTKVGDTLLVWVISRPYHFGVTGDEPSADPSLSTNAGLVRSTDDGDTWSALRRIDAELAGPGFQWRPTGLGWGGFVTSVGDTAYIVCSRGIFTSADKGVSWEIVPNNLGQLTTIPTFNHEPCYHPEKGLLLLGNPGDDRVGLKNRIIVKYSKDMHHWGEEIYELPENMVPAEPTATYQDGTLLFVTRNGSNGMGWPYAQMYSTKGWFPLESYGETDITQSGRTGDNTALIFNPVTNRYECVAGNRGGGGPGAEGTACISVNLFSISPEELLSGSTHWRFEGTLVRREGVMGEIDGHYPAGTCIDLQKGVQYICVYMGIPSTQSAVFVLVRTLNTPALREYLLSRD